MTAFSGSLNFRTTCNELAVVQHKAYEIGVQLGISHSQLMLFKQEGNPLASAVDHWLSGNVPDVPVCWESLVAALKSMQVGETGLAKTIREKYCTCDQLEEERKDSEG